MLFLFILGLVLGAVSVIFALQNVTVVTVTFLAWQVTAPLAFILLGTMMCTVIVVLLMLLPSLIRDEFYVRAIKREKRAIEDEFAQYRTTHVPAPGAPDRPQVTPEGSVVV